MRRTKELWFDRSLFSLGRERDYLIRCSFHLSDSVSECCPRDVRRSSDRSAQALSSHSDSCRQKRGYYFSLFLLLKTFAVSLIDPFRDVDCAKLSRMTTAWTASWGPDWASWTCPSHYGHSVSLSSIPASPSGDTATISLLTIVSYHSSNWQVSASSLSSYSVQHATVGSCSVDFDLPAIRSWTRTANASRFGKWVPTAMCLSGSGCSCWRLYATAASVSPAEELGWCWLGAAPRWVQRMHFFATGFSWKSQDCHGDGCCSANLGCSVLRGSLSSSVAAPDWLQTWNPDPYHQSTSTLSN